MSIPWLFSLWITPPGSGCLPSTEVTRLPRYYAPIRHLAQPAPSLAGSPFRVVATPTNCARLPLLPMNPKSVRATTTTPAASAGSTVVLSPVDIGLPRYYGGSATARPFRGPLGVRCTLRPAQSLTPQWEPYSLDASAHSSPPEPSKVLPAGTTASRVGFAPTEFMRLSRAHTTIWPKTPSVPS